MMLKNRKIKKNLEPEKKRMENGEASKNDDCEESRVPKMSMLNISPMIDVEE